MAIHLFKVLKRGDKWVVTTEDESRVLGEYKTKEGAEAQLRAIESSKHAHGKIGFRVSLHFFSIQNAPTDKWNQFAKFGKFKKIDADGEAGEEVDFNEITLSQMVDNFAARGSRIGMDYEHQAANAPLNGQPAPSLARFNALAVIANGAVVKFATLDESVLPPNPEGRSDGLYGYLCKVTPLGEQLLPNYEGISPFFSTDGHDEQGNPIGYELANVAATDVPFLGGMQPISFNRFGSAEPPKQPVRTEMDPETMKRYGIAEDASDEDKKKAMAKYADDHDEVLKRFSDLEKKFSEAEEKLKKYDAKDGDPDGDEDEKGDLHVHMAKALGLGKGANKTAIMAAFSAKMVPVNDLANLQKRLDDMEAASAAEKKAALEQTFSALADKAIGNGYDKSKRDSLIAFARADFKAAQEFVASLPAALATKRFTRHGGPIGKDAEQVYEDGIDPNEIGAEIAVKARKYSKENKVSLQQAYIALGKVDSSYGESLARLRRQNSGE